MDVDKEEADYLATAEKITLPAFVNFPEVEPPIYVLKDGGDFYYLEDTVWQFKLASEAYDYGNKELKGEVVFDSRELSRAEGKKANSRNKTMQGVLFEKHTHRMLISFTKNDKINLLKHDFAAFLALDKQYLNDQNNWVLAYNWVNLHPAFYHRYKEGSNMWEFQSGWTSKWESVGVDDKGNPRIMLEHGPFDGEDRVISSHDTRLDTYASTFEDLYIQFAKKVHKFYDNRGEDRPEYDLYGNRVDSKDKKDK